MMVGARKPTRMSRHTYRSLTPSRRGDFAHRLRAAREQVVCPAIRAGHRLEQRPIDSRRRRGVVDDQPHLDAAPSDAQRDESHQRESIRSRGGAGIRAASTLSK
jgi:hypothetical protein